MLHFKHNLLLQEGDSMGYQGLKMIQLGSKVLWIGFFTTTYLGRQSSIIIMCLMNELGQEKDNGSACKQFAFLKLRLNDIN